MSAFLKTENPGNRLPNNPDNDNCISNVADGVHCSLAGKHTCNINLGSYASSEEEIKCAYMCNILSRFRNNDTIFLTFVSNRFRTGER